MAWRGEGENTVILDIMFSHHLSACCAPTSPSFSALYPPLALSPSNSYFPRHNGPLHDGPLRKTHDGSTERRPSAPGIVGGRPCAVVPRAAWRLLRNKRSDCFKRHGVAKYFVDHGPSNGTAGNGRGVHRDPGRRYSVVVATLRHGCVLGPRHRHLRRPGHRPVALGRYVSADYASACADSGTHTVRHGAVRAGMRHDRTGRGKPMRGVAESILFHCDRSRALVSAATAKVASNLCRGRRRRAAE